MAEGIAPTTASVITSRSYVTWTWIKDNNTCQMPSLSSISLDQGRSLLDFYRNKKLKFDSTTVPASVVVLDKRNTVK